MHYDRLQRTFAPFGAERIAYATLGTGPAVLLLHGLGGSADFWRPLADDLASRYTLLIPDLLGFGFSSKPCGGYALHQHVAAIVAVLRHSGHARVRAVVGHSCGGVVALGLLASGLLRADRLALAATPFSSPRFPLRHELLTHWYDRTMLTWQPAAQFIHHTVMFVWPALRHLNVPPALQGAWAGYMDHTIPSYAGTANGCIFDANIDPLLPYLPAIPTLLLYGQSDRTVPPAQGVRLRGALPASQLEWLDGNHYAVLTGGRARLSAWLAA